MSSTPPNTHTHQPFLWTEILRRCLSERSNSLPISGEQSPCCIYEILALFFLHRLPALISAPLGREKGKRLQISFSMGKALRKKMKRQEPASSSSPGPPSQSSLSPSLTAWPKGFNHLRSLGQRRCKKKRMGKIWAIFLHIYIKNPHQQGTSSGVSRQEERGCLPAKQNVQDL